MEKKSLGKKSAKQLELLWKRALRKGVCPFKGCSIKTETCKHLDDFLTYSPRLFGRTEEGKGFMAEPRHVYTQDIDNFSLAASSKAENKEGAWALFKQIRRWGLARDQIAILTRLFGVGMSFRQVKDDMGYTSMGILYRRYRDALEILKKKGWAS